MDDVYKVTVTGTVTPQGMKIAIDTEPISMFGDSIIDLLMRAARYIEREHVATSVMTHIKNEKINQTMRDKGIIMP